MKFVLLIFWVLAICANTAYGQDMVKIRELFAQGQENEKVAKGLHEALSSRENLPPVLIGYRGASAALLAKHAVNPMNKVKYLRECQATIDSAVTLDPENFEVRMLRFAIEVKTPGIFIENDHIAEDGKFLTRHLLLDDTEVNDFHAKIAAKVVKYNGCDTSAATLLTKKYKLDDTALK